MNSDLPVTVFEEDHMHHEFGYWNVYTCSGRVCVVFLQLFPFMWGEESTDQGHLLTCAHRAHASWLRHHTTHTRIPEFLAPKAKVEPTSRPCTGQFSALSFQDQTGLLVCTPGLDRWPGVKECKRKISETSLAVQQLRLPASNAEGSSCP